MSCGDPQRKPFVWQGKRYASVQAFATRWGLTPRQVAWRLQHGITDERLNARRVRSGEVLLPARSPAEMACTFREPRNARERSFLGRSAFAADASGSASQGSVTRK